MKVITLTPDSGVPQTPSAGSSGSSSNSATQRRRSSLTRQMGTSEEGAVTTTAAAAFRFPPEDAVYRKQSDSGFCATDSSAVPAPGPHYSGARQPVMSRSVSSGSCTANAAADVSFDAQQQFTNNNM